MKFALLIPDGVGVRNFLLGDFLQRSSEKAQASVLHVVPEDLWTQYDFGVNGNVRWDTLLAYRESSLSFTLRYCLAYAQMYWADTHAMRYLRRQPVKGSWRTRAVHCMSRIIGRAAASPRRIQMFDRLHCQAVKGLPEVEHYRRLFQETRPEVLFCSHQRPPSVVPAVLAARSLGIPTATFIFSWDNLTSKGRIAAPFDHYLVWSDCMRKELLQYYPDVLSERVHIVGTPQFDSYANKNLLVPREEFFRHIGADPLLPLICYSGGDTTTCPEDQQHIRVLLELIRGGRIRGKPQVLLRPSPVDAGGRYEDVRRDYPELIYAQPEWVQTESNNWASVIPLASDIAFLANLTFHSDLNINLASTMTLDFAVHDKPVVNVAFDVSDPPPYGMSLKNFISQFEHYRPVLDLGAARFAHSPKELATHVNSYLDNPALDHEGRQRLVALEVGYPIGESSRRIFEVLQEIAKPFRVEA